MSSAAAPLPLTTSNPIDTETVKIAMFQKITYIFEIGNFLIGCLKRICQIKPAKLTLNHKSDICHWRKKSKLLAGEDEWRMHWLVVAHWHQCALTRPHPSFITIILWICICICNWVCPHSSFKKNPFLDLYLLWYLYSCICPLALMPTHPSTPFFYNNSHWQIPAFPKMFLTFFWAFLPPRH